MVINATNREIVPFIEFVEQITGDTLTIAKDMIANTTFSGTITATKTFPDKDSLVVAVTVEG